VTEVTWPHAVARPRARGLRARAATTPGRLRLASLAVLFALLVSGLVLAGVIGVRQDATSAVATRDEPLMVEADGLYASLSDADATAATTFLRGGVEPADLRAQYLADVRRATAQLADLGRRVQGSTEARAVASTGAALPVYTGLMETARANNRQGFPVGAAYLRQASDLMRHTILPAAGRLYAAEAERLGGDQRTGSSTDGVLAVVVVSVAALLVFLAAQVFLAFRMRRVFNVPLVVATVMFAVLVAWAAIAMMSARHSLSRAQRDGSDAVQVLSAARILWLRAQADESLALVARGGGDQYLRDFAVVDRLLERPRGLLGEAARLERRVGSTVAVEDLAANWLAIGSEHARVARAEQAGDFVHAVRLAVGAGSPEAALGDQINRGFGRSIAAAQRRFDAAANDARAALRGLGVGVPLVLVLCAALALVGFQARINEYR
jgi:hypothetical protein